MHKRHSSDTGALEKRKAAGWVSDDVTSLKHPPWADSSRDEEAAGGLGNLNTSNVVSSLLVSTIDL